MLTIVINYIYSIQRHSGYLSKQGNYAKTLTVLYPFFDDSLNRREPEMNGTVSRRTQPTVYNWRFATTFTYAKSGFHKTDSPGFPYNNLGFLPVIFIAYPTVKL
jgi:hypothetical protein